LNASDDNQGLCPKAHSTDHRPFAPRVGIFLLLSSSPYLSVCVAYNRGNPNPDDPWSSPRNNASWRSRGRFPRSLSCRQTSSSLGFCTFSPTVAPRFSNDPTRDRFTPPVFFLLFCHANRPGSPFHRILSIRDDFFTAMSRLYRILVRPKVRSSPRMAVIIVRSCFSVSEEPVSLTLASALSPIFSSLAAADDLVTTSRFPFLHRSTFPLFIVAPDSVTRCFLPRTFPSFLAVTWPRSFVIQRSRMPRSCSISFYCFSSSIFLVPGARLLVFRHTARDSCHVRRASCSARRSSLPLFLGFFSPSWSSSRRLLSR